MRMRHLKAGVAACALMAPFGSAMAQTAQSVTNNANVTVDRSSTIAVTQILATSATASINATGAAGSVSIAGINAPFVTSATAGGSSAPILATLGNLAQTVLNTGVISAGGLIVFEPSATSSLTLARGASLSLSATGAAAAVSIQGVSTSTSVLAAGAAPTIGNTTQRSNNENRVTLSGGQIQFTDTSSSNPGFFAAFGDASSISLSATGAASSIGLSGVGRISMPALSFGAVSQTGVNNGEVSNTGAVISSLPADPTGGTAPALPIAQMGAGFSASVSATGVVNSIGVAAIGPAQFATLNFGQVTQAATNFANTTVGLQPTAFPIALIGTGASASVASVGAANAVSFSALGTTTAPFSSVPSLGATQQTAFNQGVVSTRVEGVGIWTIGANIAGAGASASLSATGASSSISATSSVLLPTFEKGIDSSATNRGPVSSIGMISVPDGISGTGASASMSATGAASSIAVTSISSAGSGVMTASGSDSASPRSLVQRADNSGNVSNNLSALAAVSVFGDLTGVGASVSQSATGALTSISTTAIENTGRVQGLRFSSGVDVSAQNSGIVGNRGALQGGDLIGTAASVSTSATGAVAAISATSLQSSSASSFTGLVFGADTLMSATNSGAVINGDTSNAVASRVTTGNLIGISSSASVSATGALSSISSTAIGTPTRSSGSFAGLSFSTGAGQQARNSGSVTNGLSAAAPTVLQAGALTGAGSSASISATGAVASLGASLTGFAGTYTPPLFTSTDVEVQTVDHVTGNVSTFGRADVGALTGVGASVAVSATGAVASLSSSSVASGIVTNAIPDTSVAPNVVQSAFSQSGSIAASGTITAASLAGTGSSASISATGAATSISVSSIADVSVPAFITPRSVTQLSGNISTTTVSGSLRVGSLGTAASASIAGVGATASLSYRSVR